MENDKLKHEKQCVIHDVSGSCFGRISENVFKDLKSLDDLIEKMGTTKDGYKISGVGEPNDFKNRLEYYKQHLKTELPEFSIEELLKIDRHFQKLKKMYDWHGSDYMLIAIEYEVRHNSPTEAKWI